MVRPLKERFGEETVVEEQTTREWSQCTASKIAQGPLVAIEWICVEKADTYTHKGAAY